MKANTSGRVLPWLPTLSPGRVALSNIGLRQLFNLSHGLPRAGLVEMLVIERLEPPQPRLSL